MSPAGSAGALLFRLSYLPFLDPVDIFTTDFELFVNVMVVVVIKVVMIHRIMIVNIPTLLIVISTIIPCIHCT